MLKYLLLLCGAFADMIDSFKGFNLLATCFLLNVALNSKATFFLGWLMHDMSLDLFLIKIYI